MAVAKEVIMGIQKKGNHNRVERDISMHTCFAHNKRYDNHLKKIRKNTRGKKNITNGARSCAPSKAMNEPGLYCRSRSEARAAPRCAIVLGGGGGGDRGRLWTPECCGPVGLRTLIFGGVCGGRCCCRGDDEGDGWPLGLGERYGGGSAGARPAG
jgi:hypothetical protein